MTLPPKLSRLTPNLLLARSVAAEHFSSLSDPHWYGAHVLDLGMETARTLHGWLDREGLDWSQTVGGLPRITLADLVHAGHFSFITQKPEWLPKTTAAVRRKSPDNLHRIESVRASVLRDALQRDLRIPLLSQRGALGGRFHQLFFLSRQLDADIQRYLNAPRLSTQKDLEIKLAAYPLAVVLHNAAMAQAKLTQSDKLPPAAAEALGNAIFKIYGPTLRQVGLVEAGRELENEAFRQLYHDEYEETERHVTVRLQNDQKLIRMIGGALRGARATAARDPRFDGLQDRSRKKDLYSAWIKRVQRGSFDEVKDVIAYREIAGQEKAVVSDEELSRHQEELEPKAFDAYRKSVYSEQELESLRAHLHETVIPAVAKNLEHLGLRLDIPEGKNYFERPKESGYRAVHALVMDGERPVAEIQFSTGPDHAHNEDPQGAAHWIHKSMRNQTPVLFKGALEDSLPKLPEAPQTFPVNVSRMEEGHLVHHATEYLFPGTADRHRETRDDLLAFAFPDYYGHYHLECKRHPDSPAPPRGKKSNMDYMYPDLHLMVTPTDREWTIAELQEKLAQPTGLNQHTRSLLETRLREAQAAKSASPREIHLDENMNPPGPKFWREHPDKLP